MRLVLVLLVVTVAATSFDSDAAARGRMLAQEAGTASQQPAQPIFRAGTDLVRVDVTVTQRGDEPVSDLTMEDFEITEDDEPQTVETLKFIKVDGVRQSNLDEPLEIRSKEHAMLEASREDVRLFAIFLDDYHISKRPEITLPLRDALTKFVNQLGDRKSTRLNSSHSQISYAVFCLKKKNRAP